MSNRYFCLSLFACLLGPAMTPETAQSSSLQELLKKSKENSPAIKQAEANYQSKLADIDGIQEAFLPEVFSKITLGSDQTEAVSPFGGEKTKIQAYELGIRKQFKTGTQVELSAKRDRARIVYPATVPMQFQSRFNPAFNDAATIMLRQPILRNFMAREIEYSRMALEGVAQAEQSMIEVNTQVQLAQTESYYWNLMALYERRAVVRRMLQTSKEFARLMQKRTQIGRGDFVDEVAAESQVIKIENDLLNIDIQIESLSERIASHVGVDRSEVIYHAGELQSSYEGRFNSLETGPLISKALANRKDLTASQNGLKPLESQIKLASEKLKPELNVFASYATTGIDTKGSDSLGKVVKLGHPNWAVGLEFKYKIGKKAAHAERTSARAKISAAKHQINSIEQTIRRDVRIAKKQLDQSAKSLSQARLQLKTLGRKRRAEQRRVNQARSEKIAVLGFKLEELGAKNNVIQAWLSQKTAIAELKLALHEY